MAEKRAQERQVSSDWDEGTESVGTVTKTQALNLAAMPVTPFGKYRLIGKLGHGGMAEVYLSYATGLAGFRKLVVIKRLHMQLEEEPGFIEMFLDEARLAARLNNANVVQCFEVGEIDGSHFIAMEYLEGQGLDRIRRRCVRAKKKITPRIAGRIVYHALDALEYAHALKDFDGAPLDIVHRDVSPQNIFITYDGNVKLLDFGIAKAATHVVETRTGVIKGKFSYMAPEQAKSGEIDGRADIWSAGVVLWEVLANRRLFKGPTDLATIDMMMNSEVPGLEDHVSDLPDGLTDVVHRALQRDVEERYQSAAEMRDDLERVFSKAPDGMASRDEVSEFVKELFGDDMEHHREMVQLCLKQSENEDSVESGVYPVAPVGSMHGSVTPPSMGSTSGPMLTPTEQTSVRGWAGKIGFLIAIVLVAVLSTLIVLWVMGPPRRQGGDELLEPGRSELAAREGATPTKREPAESRAKSSSASESVQPIPEGEGAGSSEGQPSSASREEGSAGSAEQTGATEEGAGASSASDVGNEEAQEASADSSSTVEARRLRALRARQQRERQQREREREAREERAEARSEEAAAPQPEPQPPREPAVVEQGFLTIDTVPWSHVRVGGRSLGNTPVINARLPAGTHTLRLTNPEQSINRVYRVRIRPGETTTKRLGLR